MLPWLHSIAPRFYNQSKKGQRSIFSLHFWRQWKPVIHLYFIYTKKGQTSRSCCHDHSLVFVSIKQTIIQQLLNTLVLCLVMDETRTVNYDATSSLNDYTSVWCCGPVARWPGGRVLTGSSPGSSRSPPTQRQFYELKRRQPFLSNFVLHALC